MILYLEENNEMKVVKVTAVIMRARCQLRTLRSIPPPRWSDYASHLQRSYVAYSNSCAYKMAKTYFRNLFKIHVALLVVSLYYLVFFFFLLAVHY